MHDPPSSHSWAIKQGNLDIAYLLTLPEFDHWHTFGWDVVQHDVALLQSGGETLLDLFRRGPIERAWYEWRDNWDGLEDGIVVGNSKMTRKYQPAYRDHDESRAIPDLELRRPLRRQRTPEGRSTRLFSAAPLVRRAQPVVRLSHSPPSVLQAPSLRDFVYAARSSGMYLGEWLRNLHLDFKELDGFARAYRRSYERLWAEIEYDDWYALEGSGKSYAELRDDWEGASEP